LSGVTHAGSQDSCCLMNYSPEGSQKIILCSQGLSAPRGCMGYIYVLATTTTTRLHKHWLLYLRL